MRVLGTAPLIAVSDVRRSVDFYRRFGFAVDVQWPTYARLAAPGGAVLHLAALGEPPPDRPTVSLALPTPGSGTVTAIVVVQVSDCRQAWAELAAAGVRTLTEPTEPEWGGEVRAFVRDPDGHLLELNQQLPST